ncbi:MAG TPA: hypothetical protein VGZ22_22335, partial [Isosphaeraceae bacterium]|nr:hypothetical protein [Isosphaeraceae bacterium]
MAGTQQRGVVGRLASSRERGRRIRKSVPAHCEVLEPRSLLAATVTVLPVSTQAAGLTEGSSVTAGIAQVVDSDPTVTAANFQVTINWGDGTPLDTTSGSVSAIAGVSGNAFDISGTHTYSEEAGSTVPPFAFNITVTVKDTKNNVTSATVTQGLVTDAGLSQGNPVTGIPQRFAGTGNNTGASLASFESAVGGVDNGNTAAPQNGGFREINWDGVKLDGTDFGGGANTTV